jgi:glycoprotein 2-beta-D-xylosyltransferase
LRCSYHAAISQGMGTRGGDCAGEPHVRQFGHDFTRALGLTPRSAATCGTAPETNVVFVRRVHYRAHPRHNGRIVRRLDNEDEIFTALEAGAAADGGSGGLRVLNGLFSSMTVTEQVAMVQEGCLLVGAHGAGLSHVLFAPDGVHMLELQPPEFQRPHFIAYTRWAGGAHHLWALESAHPAVDAVVARIRDTAKVAGASQG